MYPTFTGNTKSKRQVNLSGRNNNPFAAYGSPKPSATIQTSQNPVTHAKQERVLREQQRQRPPAATCIQRTWRGHRSRKETRKIWRQHWDSLERWNTREMSNTSYETPAQCLQQLRLLAQFASPRSEEDIRRIQHFGKRYHAFTCNGFSMSQEACNYPTFSLGKTVVKALRNHSAKTYSPEIVTSLLYLLSNLTATAAPFLALHSLEYYEAVLDAARAHAEPSAIQSAVVELLVRANTRSEAAYEGFAWAYLTQDQLPGFADNLRDLSFRVDYRLLAGALSKSLANKSTKDLLQADVDDRLLWLLSRFIYFHRNSTGTVKTPLQPDTHYVTIVSKLISTLADDIGRRIDAVELLDNQVVNGELQVSSAKRLPDFIRSQMLDLISKESVSGLLTRLESDRATPRAPGHTSEASTLASYVLTLLRVFPKRRSDIQFWLYRGSSVTRRNDRQVLPATKYFYEAAKSTQVFQSIFKDPQQAISCLSTNKQNVRGSISVPTAIRETKDQEWRVVLLFLELYTFNLQVMDDDEFLSGTTDPSPDASWTRQSALPMSHIESLAVFLRNLAFALYWYSSEIAGEDRKEASQSIGSYFRKIDSHPGDMDDYSSIKAEEREVGDISGMTVTSVKGLVVGVLRMIYEREYVYPPLKLRHSFLNFTSSRRKFLPKNLWLMTRYFEMDRFISSVVEEEEHGRQIEESYEEVDEPISRNFAGAGHDYDDHNHYADDPQLVGTHRVQQLRNMERLKAQQRKASKRKYLDSVTPRLRILENMPFFIPFHTRVQVFRQFVALDQQRRRGTTDADEWRYAMMNSPTGNISRHRATVRREHVFDDAYNQYYDLGEGLKEPIQIRFVDQFGTVEEGIDGGGVTKEFLTSVTGEAFAAAHGQESLFVTNDQHLLFPNPATVEERKETMRRALYKEGSPDWNDNVRDLLRRYEFLGRIVGKCLYEGILVDVHFAPFFLLKWALTGGTGSGSKETGYRASLNDLRDLDEGFYQGLLELKNYPGNVQEDFGLDFTISETLKLSPTQTKTITRDLRPDGSSTPVTNDNRLVYIAAVARYRLQQQPYLQTSAFLSGLGTIVSPNWLSMFNQSELQTLIGGSGTEVSISDLRANTQYGGVYVIGDDGMEHPSIELFWKVMQSLSSEDVAKVLKFVTSTPRGPLLGFGNLNPRFSIRDSGPDQTRLPSTSTCVNLLKLPVYHDEKTLKERLLYSVNAGAGFNLS
ncbi:uncharacterized protein KY384_004356 [Bacidia gigantensis]|uniref:uncharacterized protein n=1 Tax=Bacidia gigantensis TaxID=2732470 RepID=UPI001D05603B|nr:uncharacterized protein KY384_004356 [Bacidia gigantensis]KAG8530999.1 hypothetical protein KY384_004356 [Bacidia gigantensis]